MNSLLRHILLIATWIFLATIIVYLWVAKSLEPPFWSFIILLAIAVVPLAARVKIGNWFDFTKKVNDLTQEVNSNKEDIQQLGTQLTHISSQLQNVTLTKQAQHQIVANFPNPETAKAFAQSFAAPPESPYPPPAAERAGKEDKDVIYFLWAADRVITSAELFVMALYSWVISWLEGNDSVLFDKRPHQPTKRLIQELRQIYEKHGQEKEFPTIKDKMPQQLDVLENFIDLRNSVAHGKLKPPPINESRDIIRKATIAVYFIGGIVTARLVASNMAFLPRTSLPPQSAS